MGPLEKVNTLSLLGIELKSVTLLTYITDCLPEWFSSYSHDQMAVSVKDLNTDILPHC